MKQQDQLLLLLLEVVIADFAICVFSQQPLACLLHDNQKTVFTRRCSVFSSCIVFSSVIPVMSFRARFVCYVSACPSSPTVTHDMDPTVLGPNTATVATAALPEVRARGS